MSTIGAHWCDAVQAGPKLVSSSSKEENIPAKKGYGPLTTGKPGFEDLACFQVNIAAVTVSTDSVVGNRAGGGKIVTACRAQLLAQGWVPPGCALYKQWRRHISLRLGSPNIAGGREHTSALCGSLLAYPAWRRVNTVFRRLLFSVLCGLILVPRHIGCMLGS
ncbi:hypothetical protein RRG08_014620 [Elysia crispata]|uniref:Uncharacterized protein n=1 Tax=Elysia crispata TaxID=231223 RepID=A0AAE1D393_9GAST|nr:hypothetical protein RRG08_014620 [Elysia crispata]